MSPRCLKHVCVCVDHIIWQAKTYSSHDACSMFFLKSCPRNSSIGIPLRRGAWVQRYFLVIHHSWKNKRPAGQGPDKQFLQFFEVHVLMDLRRSRVCLVFEETHHLDWGDAHEITCYVTPPARGSVGIARCWAVVWALKGQDRGHLPWNFSRMAQ